MASSKKWARLISSIASCIYFSIIFFQVPLFRVPCRSGICRSPVEVTSSQLFAHEVCPAFVVKALLYPGAVANAIIRNKNIPSSDKLVKLYNLANVKKAPAITDLQLLEVIAGSYLCVGGAVLSLIKPSRMSLFGILLVIWGIAREFILRKPFSYINRAKTIPIDPVMLVAVICAFLAVRRDIRRIISSFRPRHVAKSLRFKAKFT